MRKHIPVRIQIESLLANVEILISIILMPNVCDIGLIYTLSGAVKNKEV